MAELKRDTKKSYFIRPSRAESEELMAKNLISFQLWHYNKNRCDTYDDLSIFFFSVKILVA
jgi:hypothetical protein